MVVPDGGEALVAQQLLPDLGQAGLKLRLAADVRVGPHQDDGGQRSRGLKKKPQRDEARHRPRLEGPQRHGTHLDVEEPGLEGVHLAGSSAEVVHHQVEGPGGQEVGVRAAEFLAACGREKPKSSVGIRF